MNEFAAKDLKFKQEVTDALLRGAKTVYDAVSATYGHGGNLVMYQHPSYLWPVSTKDGVSVARMINLKDKFEDLGAQTVIQAANRQLHESGDGTTLTTVLAYELFLAGVKAIHAGYNRTLIRKGIMEAVEITVTELKKISKKCQTVNDLANVATVALNGDRELGELIAKAVLDVGEYGIVQAVKGKSVKHSVNKINGYFWDKGIEWTDFINTGSGEMVYEQASIVVVSKPVIAFGSDLIELSKIVADTPCVIIAPEIKDEALAMIIKANKEKGYKFSWIRPSGVMAVQKRELENIAAITGATIVGDDTGSTLSGIKAECLGVADVRSKFGLTILSNGGGTTDKRISDLKALISATDDEVEQKHLKSSIAKLLSGLANIEVGGSSETEQKEVLDRVEDAILSCRSAKQEGVVPGGGVALLSLKKKIKAKVDDVGGKIVYNVLDCSIKKILENAGCSSQYIVSTIEKGRYKGFKGNKPAKDMGSTIDPTKVIRTALQNASSVACMLLQTDVLIVNKEDK